tara:strand:+ start:858 stop:1265 length:408 start_codon:yes stop_codon:yes gene_type:complete
MTPPIIGRYDSTGTISLGLTTVQARNVFDDQKVNALITLRNGGKILRRPLSIGLGASEYSVEMRPHSGHSGIFQANSHRLIIPPESKRILGQTRRIVGAGVYDDGEFPIDLELSGFEDMFRLPYMGSRSHTRARA